VELVKELEKAEKATHAKKKSNRKAGKTRVMNSDKEAMDSETITQRSPLHGLDPLDSEVLDCIEVAW